MDDYELFKEGGNALDVSGEFLGLSYEKLYNLSRKVRVFGFCGEFCILAS
jgi:hypothetical protein